VEEQRTVGAELGQDAIDAGRISTMIAFSSVLVFMILAYGWLFGGISGLRPAGERLADHRRRCR
jgi:preprotein translocase subunit SecD